MDYRSFVSEKIREISDTVGDGSAITALSGGVDSATVAVMGHKALGDRLQTVFIDNGLMRENEPENVAGAFKDLGIEVQIVDAQAEFFKALKGKDDPEEKRQAITDTFYGNVFSKIVKQSGAKYLLQGTNLTDVDETVAGIKRQHNVLAQLGIDPEQEYGYRVIEPLIELRKDEIREAAKALGLPESIYSRIPFPGPALATRIIGEITAERVERVRKATAIVEEELHDSGAFQYLAVLMNDKATGVRDGKRDYGDIIVVRSVESVDARTATPTKLSWETLDKLAGRLTTEVPGVVRVLYDLTPKPPATIEYI